MQTEYKRSQFNCVCKKENEYLIYNTLYNSLSRLSEQEYRQYCHLGTAKKELIREFASQGVIVSKEIDELRLYHTYTFLGTKYQKPKPNITVTPTMECNARCFYCYEEGIRCAKMKDGCAEKIIAFLKKMDLRNGIYLTWFGGEPLLNQQWMDYFADCLKKEKISFTSFLITNGSKINEEIIRKMRDCWNIKSIQITLDGTFEEYIKRKNYIVQDEFVYDRILQNIKGLSRADIFVQIRLNIDRENAESILELVHDLQQGFYKNANVTYYPAFLTGSKNALSEREKIDIIKQILKADKNKLPVNSYLYKLPKTGACYYNQRGAYSIDAEGNIFICERMLGHSSMALGNVKDGFEPGLEERGLSGREQMCQSCVFLPKCSGGCQNARNHGDPPCFIDKYIITAYLEML